MKTQNLIAVALTIALISAAATLAIWRYQSDPPGQERSVATHEPQVNHAPALIDAPEPLAANGSAGASTPMTWTGLPIAECKWGSQRLLDEASGEMLWACTRSGYWNYTTETLESMAYDDAEAARVLAHRVRETDYPRALNLVQRAAALSGDVTALIEARKWRPLAHRNGDMDLSGVGQAYVLMEAADRINKAKRSRSADYEAMIRQIADDPDVTLQELDDIVNYMLHRMRQIELEVTGQSTIGGDDDA